MFTIATNDLAVEAGRIDATTQTATVRFAAGGAFVCEIVDPLDSFADAECEYAHYYNEVQGYIDQWTTFTFHDYSSNTDIPVTLRVSGGTNTYTVEAVWGHYECE